MVDFICRDMKKEVKFSLAYRDMWQSSGKYMPTAGQLKEVAPAIIATGCFDRVETNGGAFEQVCLMAGENPNTAVREWTAPFKKAGIQTQMLERGLNGLRMNPVPADVRELMYKVKKAQGTDIARSFCGLNDTRNLQLSVEYAKKAGMISQVALAVTDSPVHTVEYYMGIVDQVVEYGCDEICLKDMAGIGRPSFLAGLTSQIKCRHPHLIVQYHGHSGPGFSPASMLEVARAGADYLDVAMEPLSWGKVHPDVITIREMLKADGFTVKDIDMEAYMQARSLTQKHIDDFLGHWIDSNNSSMSSLLVGCGLPGGMMGSMMADLKSFQGVLNASLRTQGKPELSLDQMMVRLFQEVEYAWPRLGYPPLVTPFSQYVKNTALMNLMASIKGQPRWSMIDKDTWNMILGNMGRLPGALAPEIIELAEANGYKFFDGTPQEKYPDALESYRTMMDREGWDYGQDDEELFEFAMHERQYRDYRSGDAKKRFTKELEEAVLKNGIPMKAPSKGRMLWEIDVEDVSTAPAPGTPVSAGRPIGYVQTHYGMEEIVPAVRGRIISVSAQQGEEVYKGQTIALIAKADA